MPPEPPLTPLDLLVVGGLTVDRFTDGTDEPGGSVLHVVRAAVPRGLHVGVVTTAGPEPAAQRGLAELRDTVPLVEVAEAPRTATFRHRETEVGRRLWLEHGGGRIVIPPGLQERPGLGRILFAPVADELGADQLGGLDDTFRTRAAILQGWLRDVDEQHREVRPRDVRALDPAVVAVPSTFDLLVASREDLGKSGGDLSRLVWSLRGSFGRRPTILLTDGPNGVWVQRPQLTHASDPEHVPAPSRVEAVRTTGAGDVFAAFMLFHWRDDVGGFRNLVTRAMQVVVEVLEERSRS